MSSLWLREDAPARPAVTLSGPPDAIVVGGGVSGCSCALALAERGLRVRLHEAREIAGGASGRNGGFALRGGAISYHDAVAALGHADARALWRLSERALDEIERLAGDALHRVGSLRLAADEAELDDLRGRDGGTGSRRLRGGGARTVGAGSRRAVRRRASSSGRRRTPACPLGPASRRARRRRGRRDPRARAGRLARRARRPARRGRHGRLHPRARPGARRRDPPDARAGARNGAPRRTLFPGPHYARHGYDYWQQLRDGRLVVGGRRDAALERSGRPQKP